MSKIIVLSVLALSFTTGFTCSKNAPKQAAPEVQAPAQADMATPVSADATAVSADATTAPAGVTPAAPAGTK